MVFRSLNRMWTIYVSLAAIAAIANGSPPSIETGRDFCGLEEGVGKAVTINGLFLQVIIKHEPPPGTDVWVGLDFMDVGERWNFDNEYTQHTSITLVDDEEEIALRALRPMIQELRVESDLQVRMQQDNSVNPSVIYAIFTKDLTPTSYTFDGFDADNTYIVISEDKLHLQCGTIGRRNLCGNQNLSLPERDDFTASLLFKGAEFRPTDGYRKDNKNSRNKYTWKATHYRLMGKMAICDWVEPSSGRGGSCTKPVTDDMSTITDSDESTCVSPFISGRLMFNLDLIIHLLRPREPTKVIVLTDVKCQEPYTMLGIRRNTASGTSESGGIIYNQCALLSAAISLNSSNICLFSCSCFNSCDGKYIVLKQQFLSWKDTASDGYRTCEVKIMSES